MSKLEQFLKESSLSDDAKALILEAWNDEKRDMVAVIRDEMKQRFEADKAAIVEGLNTMAQAVISEEMTKVYDEKRKLVEDRAVLRTNLSKFSDFSNGVLAQEIGELRKDRLALGESLKKFAEFSNGIIAEEVKEYHAEKRALVETRVRLMAEGRKKLHEAQAEWIKRTSAGAAKFIEEQTRNEFTQLRTQLDEANKNMFGRKLFEAFASEFMSSHYSESKELRKLAESVKAREAQLNTASQKLAESNDRLNAVTKKLRIMEDTQQRGSVLSQLMKPLTAEQRMVMESLLEKTPTEKLSEDFNKYLKPVLNESGKPARKPAQRATTPLNESAVKEVTGNRTMISEGVEEDSFNAELEKLAQIAGIRK